ncbi:LacI family transcriptional regulator [Reichenbachiella carrageenanivorans]|uniref:LacI family transcriptional regulator n=1 Tax=Reichenbachiella carrageenanivorans TaxID=2979869 RepID=A0ABY6CVD5_9BACT|nr:LacI family DNA-binding transcriptional regulator [Reichenbachiella carrageenanivorans]UXX77864.1 LacI family transcriptional regulator [Reichenbachiella carrageenanivorans]
MKHVTIKDVARKLGVSISSVSRAFNDKYDIKPETKARILSVADELGYRPNPIAKKLIKQQSLNIGIIVPEFINDFYARVIIGVQQVLIAKGYQVLIMQSDENPDLERNNTKTLLDNFVDGLIVCPINEHDNILYFKKQISQGVPIVFLGRISAGFIGSKIIFDDYKWSLFATEHLINQGYQTIYHLSGDPQFSVSKKRKAGFLKAMEKHKIPESNYKIIAAGLTAEAGELATTQLIQKEDVPEALFCINDPVALGAMKALRTYHINIPQDIAIVGCTETPMAPLAYPPLTSITQPAVEMGASAAELLLRQIEHGFNTPQTITFDGLLNIRESSTRPIVNS